MSRFISNLKLPCILGLCTILLFGCTKDESDNNGHDIEDLNFEEPQITGNTFYIDPINGSANGNGSAENPWRTLQEVIANGKIRYYIHTENYNPDSDLELINEDAPVKGGDRLILRNGYHGYVTINNFTFKDWLIIEAENNHKPVLSQFKIEGAFAKLYLKNLVIIKDSYEGDENYWEAEAITHNSNSCLYLASSSFWGKGSEVKINGLTLKTTEDISSWSADDWVTRAASGLGLRSVEYVEVVNCTIENIRHGIAVEYFSDHSKVVNNTINNFSGDGSRVISNDVLFAYNTITNSYKVDDNHDDALQSYTRGEDMSPGTGVLSDVVIRGNLIIGETNMSNTLTHSPQGIGCFDGFFENWTIENNVVIVDHYHGISFYGMRNGKIVNNTVIDLDPNNSICPWITINPHKDGTPSENCIIANNIVSSIIIAEDYIDQKCNYIFGKSNYSEIYNFFVDPDDRDFHLLDNETTREYIIDKGEVFNNLSSSEIDKDKIARTSPPDLGAYELQ